jgi:hypothetical protein
MAYAYSNLDLKVFKTEINSKGIISTLYNGTATDGHKIYFQFYDGNINTGILKSIYPSNFK